MATVTINIKVPVDIYRDGPVHVANCRRFGVVTQGCSIEEAKSNLVEALTLFLETCFEMGTLEEVLKESGFRRAGDNDQDLDQCKNHLELSLPFFATNHLRECRA
jgi:predicted RNase H-like HicB family nuclease